MKAKKRVTGLVLAVILSFVGELHMLLVYHDCVVDGDSDSGGDGVNVDDGDGVDNDEDPKKIVSCHSMYFFLAAQDNPFLTLVHL